MWFVGFDGVGRLLSRLAVAKKCCCLDDEKTISRRNDLGRYIPAEGLRRQRQCVRLPLLLMVELSCSARSPLLASVFTRVCGGHPQSKEAPRLNIGCLAGMPYLSQPPRLHPASGVDSYRGQVLTVGPHGGVLCCIGVTRGPLRERLNLR